MAILSPYIRFNESQMRKVLGYFQNYLQLLFLHMRVIALSDTKSLRMLVGDGDSDGGMINTDMFKLLKNGDFQSEIGFPVRYNPEAGLTRALRRNLSAKVWRSSRTIRLSRIFWRLNYKQVMDEVKYRIPSGKGKGGYMYWLEFISGQKMIPNYAFRPLRSLRGGAEGAVAMGKKGQKRPRAYGRPGVGATKAGYMVKGKMNWTLTRRANPYNVKDDWFMQGVDKVAPPLLAYWKKKALTMHRTVLRRYKSSFRGKA